MICRHCESRLEHVFIDLGHAPPSNAYLTAGQLEQPEVTYPLKLLVCDTCWLVQVPEHAPAQQLFHQDYAYFSSVSSTWVEHARRYVSMIAQRGSLDKHSFVTEIASNDGYLLQFFQERAIPCLGIEPTASTAEAARRHGIETLEAFFGLEFARELRAERGPADLLVANNVLAHVPDINDFVAGVREMLAPQGVATLEFPHLMQLIEQVQFDTIYHEHFSYLTLYTVGRILESQKLEVFDVEELSTHGGSLRLYVQHRDADVEPIGDSVSELLRREAQAGMQQLEFILGFQDLAERSKNNLLRYLLDQKREGRLVAAYGAAAKGNTLLNFAGVKPDLLSFVCDAAPSKQRKFLPGSHLPILAPEALRQQRPDRVLILPWNIRDEIAKAHAYVRSWGGRFAVNMPELLEF